MKHTEKAGQIISLGRANPKQAKFFESRTLYTAYGGARGGGKSWAVRVKAVGGALKWPGIRILIVRRTYPELEQNHIIPVKRMVPPEAGTYSSTTRTMTFLNGSSIRFGHFQAKSAETEYQGQEYDWIFMDEATQFTESEFRLLGGCLRGVSDVPKRFYLTCNPGGIGHRWVKRLFIDREFRTDCANPEENENPEDYSFIFASVEDNEELLKHSPGYVRMLAGLPERLRRAHRYGDWDALGGTFFSEFSEEGHVCRPFRIPDGWVRYRSFDYGLDMFACLWAAVAPDGRCYIYRELCRKDLIAGAAADEMLRLSAGESITATFAPPDMWSRQKDTGKSIADIFQLRSAGLIRAGNDRVQGHMQIKEMLADMGDGRPGLVIFDSCRRLIECLKSIQADDRNPSDCAKTPHEVTHSVDALRYFCVSRLIGWDAEKTGTQDEEIEEGESYEELMTGGDADMSYIGF